jgi:hypothetical protein
MHDKSLVNGFNIQTNPLEMNLCNGFLHEGKQGRNKISIEKGSRATQLLELVHSDLRGPMQTKCMGGSCYFGTFIDHDHSRRNLVSFMG